MMRHSLICAVISLLSMVHSSAEDEWPRWRGPDGRGHAVAAVDLPVHWSTTKNVAWFTGIPGRGHSSPVISGQQIWVTTALETEASKEEIEKRRDGILGDYTMLAILSQVTMKAVCIDRGTGKILKQIELLTVEDPQGAHRLNSYATPTPVIRQGRLYCHFGAYGNACVEVSSGKVLWTNTELFVEHINGPVSKPILWKNLMIFHMDGGHNQFVAALDVGSGKVVWKTDRSGELPKNPQVRKSYSTPLIMKVEGKDQLISPAANWLFAYDPATGRELWKFEYGNPGYSNVSSPIEGDGLLFLPTGYGTSEMSVLRLKGEQLPEVVWRHKKGAPRTSSPILVDKQLYYISDSGILSCLEAKSGKVNWQERLNGNYSVSPLYADGHLFFCSQEGKVQVIDPGVKYQPISINEMGSPIMSSPAAVGKAIYLRTVSGMFKLQK